MNAMELQFNGISTFISPRYSDFYIYTKYAINKLPSKNAVLMTYGLCTNSFGTNLQN